MIKVNTIEKFVELAYTGGTLLQLDLPGRFMLTIYKHYQKEVIILKHDKGNFVRFAWIELDY
jgi:hypothetical protein